MTPCLKLAQYLKKLVKKIFPFTKDGFIYKIYFKNFIKGRVHLIVQEANGKW